MIIIWLSLGRKKTQGGFERNLFFPIFWGEYDFEVPKLFQVSQRHAKAVNFFGPENAEGS